MRQIVAMIGLLIGIGALCGALASAVSHVPACVAGSAAATITDCVAR